MVRISSEELVRLAQKGDAKAQYTLAGLLSNAGRHEEAGQWLQSAAQQGDPDALYTVATSAISTRDDIEALLPQLHQSAVKGSTAARRLVGAFEAVGFCTQENWRAGVARVVEAAKKGDPAAMRELAMVMFMSDPENEAAAKLIDVAAEGDPIAGAISLARIGAGRKNHSFLSAQRVLDRLQGARYPRIEIMRQWLAGAKPCDSLAPMNPDWALISDQLTETPSFELHALDSETLCDSPNVQVFRQALTREECEYLIAAGAAQLAPSQIVDPTTGQSRPDEYRTSLTAILGPVDFDLVIGLINRRLSALVGIPETQGEFLSILYYAEGQQYKPHFDWLGDGDELERSGQRIATALCYLNEDFDGGETRFLSPNIDFKGSVGDVLVFQNVTSDGQPDMQSQHEGAVVTSGAKWLASKWFRERTYQF